MNKLTSFIPGTLRMSRPRCLAAILKSWRWVRSLTRRAAHGGGIALLLSCCATSGERGRPLAIGGTDTKTVEEHDADAWCNLGSAAIEAENYDEAIAAYRKAIQLDPLHSDSHVYLGVAYALKGEEKHARSIWNNLIQLKPNDAKVRYNIGVSLENLGDGDAAIEAYREAIRLNPRYAQAHNNIGSILWRRFDSEGAIRCFEAALVIDPDLASARQNLEMARRGRWRFSVGPPD
jgi:Flp pilus assembly protein TadD